jgi:hypothetical protein
MPSSKSHNAAHRQKRWVSAFDHIIPENFSGWEARWRRYLPRLRRRNYFVVPDKTVGGDAPKDFIQVYEYGVVRRSNRRNWTPYIAKAAYKWYPNESVTEHLLNRLGQVMGLNMAESKLILAGEHIRFLSRYFLKSNEQLMHGAQIYAAYLLDDAFVQEVDRQKLESELFPFQEAERAIRQVFPDQAENILHEFVKLLIFDAIVGNSDRHFYNWGVILDILGKSTPRFSPIYDTARGLLWNESEKRLLEIEKIKGGRARFLEKYVQNSRPKIGWEGEKNINHLRFIEKFYHEDKRFCHLCTHFLAKEHLEAMLRVLDFEFGNLFSTTRKLFIRECLEMRFESLRLIINNSAP